MKVAIASASLALSMLLLLAVLNQTTKNDHFATLEDAQVEESPVNKNSNVAQNNDVMHGYLPKGDSLVGMPLTFKHNVGDRCREACVKHVACHGFTYDPSQGVCYLKSVAHKARGTNCKKNCWYSGYVSHRPITSLSLSEAEKQLGLKAVDVVVGKGERLRRGDVVHMGYVGKLDDGTVFDSGKYVFEFGRGQVIEGDDIGLKGMRLGGERKLTIPPSLAYGRDGYPGSIPPEATLHFDVKILHIERGQKLSSGYKE